MQLRPFRALRPAPAVAARVVSPPYDVVTRGEASALAAGEPMCFLHVVRSEIDLPDDVDAHDQRVYARARRNLEDLCARGVLVRDADPALYVYREIMDGRAQVGVVGCVSVADDERDVIRKHERTRPDKEDDRTRHILSLEAHAEPVLFAYRGREEVDGLVAAAMRSPALYDLTTGDGVRHTVWRAPDAAALVDAFARVPRAYVADGHHRSAAARRAAATLRGNGPRREDAEHEWFPAALCPADRLAILAYHRVVRDLGGLTAAEVLARLARVGRLSASATAAPPRAGSFGIYLDRRWYLLELEPVSSDGTDPLASLDVCRLGERVLGPVLGITDQAADPRLDFAGGARGAEALAARVDAGEAALAVAMHPTSMGELMAVADAGAIMPPKSTWFAPKLLSGFFVHSFAPSRD